MSGTGSCFWRIQKQAISRARAILFATAIVEVTAPDMPDLHEAVTRGLLRYCPVCDGFEAIDQRIGVLGGREGSIDEAHFLRTFSQDVTYMPVEGAPLLTSAQLDQAQDAGIKIEHRSCVGLKIQGDVLEARFASGEPDYFATVYPCLGTRPRSELAQAFGVSLSDDLELVTDAHQSTSVSGVYAAGDVLKGLDQVSSACGQGAIASVAIHNRLRGR